MGRVYDLDAAVSMALAYCRPTEGEQIADARDRARRERDEETDRLAEDVRLRALRVRVGEALLAGKATP